MTLTATMSGAAAVPTGAPTGKGSASISIGERRMCWALTYRGIDQPLAASIRRGRAGIVGPITVQLGRTFQPSGCVAAPPALTADAILVHPGSYYIALPTRRYPGGAIRGQLVPPPPERLNFYSFGGFTVSFDAPQHGRTRPRTHVVLSVRGGSSCGKDPGSAVWTIPFAVDTGTPSAGSLTASFAQANPFRIYSFVDFLADGGSVTVDLSLVLDPTPVVRVQAVASGAVSSLAVAPDAASLPIQKTVVGSC